MMLTPPLERADAEIGGVPAKVPSFLSVGLRNDFASFNGISSFDWQAENHPPHSGIGEFFRRPDPLAVH